jgi:thiosulfate/3-mercaptopyruvate sulfurtransferase
MTQSTLHSYTTLISTGELELHVSDPAFVIVDCRHNLSDVNAGQRAYDAAHIPGARFMHIDRDLSGPLTGANGRHPLPDIALLAEALGREGIDATTQVVAYDQNSGMWASRLWWLMKWIGHDAVAVLDGGLDKWLIEGRRTTAATPAARNATYTPSQPIRTASAEEIVRHLGDKSLTIVDARAAERYRGDIEPMDPVAGHIPGAINRPYSLNLTAQGTFKTAAQLRGEFDAMLAESTPMSIVHQCGSGVTACHNILAMEIAGLPGSRLYPGSWSEWVADPSRPVVRGNAKDR